MSGSLPRTGAVLPRTVALVGPYGSGKSTLFDALMARAGAPSKRVTEPQARAMSTELRVGHCQFLGDPWAILDCPGSIEFAYETACALDAADLALIVCEPVPQRLASLPLLLHMLEEHGLPFLVFLNKIEMFSGNLNEITDLLQDYLKRPLALRQLQIRAGETVSGFIDIASHRAYHYKGGQGTEPGSELIEIPQNLREQEEMAFSALAEKLADQDDRFLERMLEGEMPSGAEIFEQLSQDQAAGTIAEVLLGSALRGYGITRLWKALRHDAPSATATAERHGIGAGSEPLIHIFKTSHHATAAHAGKLSFGRVWRGTVKDGATMDGVRIGALYHFVSGDAVRVKEAEAGDVIALARLESISTGQILGLRKGEEQLASSVPPPPTFALAIKAKNRLDDAKLAQALHKLVEEDPSLSLVQDLEAGVMLLQGQGEIHVQSALERLSTQAHLAVESGKPPIACRETIGQTTVEHARLKRQTGGHGQFADVILEIAPRRRGEGFVFIDRIVGGAIPKQFIPAIRDAAEEAMSKGPLGYRVVDVSVTLLDGSYHTVDSSEQAFKTATRMAISAALAKAKPKLLEPIDHVTVTVPRQNTPDAQRLLSGRRGQILGYREREGWPGWDEIEAMVPAAELQDFVVDLRSDTQGLGSYRHEFDHLAEAATMR